MISLMNEMEITYVIKLFLANFWKLESFWKIKKVTGFSDSDIAFYVAIWFSVWGAARIF